MTLGRYVAVFSLGLASSCIVSGASVDPSLDRLVAAGGEGGGGPAPMCTSKDPGNACWVCQAEKCCAEQDACNDSAECTSIKDDCLKVCTKGVSSCILQCAAQNPEGNRVLAPLLACAKYRCFGACAQTQNDPCSSCLQASCAEQQFSCDRDGACFVLNACYSTCKDDPDFDSCVAVCEQGAGEETTALQHALTDCQAQFCAVACGS